MKSLELITGTSLFIMAIATPIYMLESKKNTQNRKTINFEGRSYFVSSYDGKTQVGHNDSLATSTLLIDKNSNGFLDEKNQGMIAGRPPARAIRKMPYSQEDQRIFTEVVKRYNKSSH